MPPTVAPPEVRTRALAAAPAVARRPVQAPTVPGLTMEQITSAKAAKDALGRSLGGVGTVDFSAR